MTSTNAIAQEKGALRRKFRRYRSSLSEAAYRAKSTTICERAAALPELQRAETVHLYWPQTDRREIDTRPLIRRLQDEDKQIVMPRVTTLAPKAAPQMEHVRFAGKNEMRTNRWGLREPDGSDLVMPETLDAVVVPTFGAGRNGHRIGHGRGFYDAFLGPLTVFTVGLVYTTCLVDSVPTESHDVPLNVLVTESETWRCNS